MRRASWRSGRAVVAVAAWVGLVGPVGSARAQDRAEPAAKGRFVEIPGHVINLDQIVFLRTNPGVRNDTGVGDVTADVFFTRAGGSFSLDPEQTRQLLAAIRSSEAGRVANAQPAAATGSRFVAFDGFNGKLGLNWKPVRPDPTHVSLTRNPGKLTITTQRGSIHGEEARDEAGNPIPARNLYLIDNPLADDADFVLTTRVDGFTPESTYQQAGLIVHDDDDNYVKWGYEYNWRESGGQTFYGVTEKAAVPTHHPVASESGLKRYWLRLTRRGDRYEFASSLDGKAYRVHGEAIWGGAPKRIGLVAKNGGPPDIPEVDVPFDFFEVRSPAPEKPAGDPREE